MSKQDAALIRTILDEPTQHSKTGQFTKLNQQSGVRTLMNEFRSKAIVDAQYKERRELSREMRERKPKLIKKLELSP